MFERLWNALMGDLNATQIGFIAGALGFCWNQLSLAWERRKQIRNMEIEKALEEAVIGVANTEEARNAKANLDTHNDISSGVANKLLETAVDAAIHVGEARGLGIEKQLGGREGVKLATQTVFKQIKNVFNKSE